MSSLPTEILVSVEPPYEDGGMPVTGYRVEFEDQAQDFDIGLLLTMLLAVGGLRRPSVVRTLVFGWRTFPDLWLTCDHFVGEVSTMGQPI